MSEKKSPSQQNQNLVVNFPPELKNGAYTNNAIIAHADNGEEFTIDFLFMHPAGSSVVSRVVLSPQHYKRLVHALSANLIKYESLFGTISDVLPKKIN
jgi:hypothetical protein